jgi:hypothetical protein
VNAVLVSGRTSDLTAYTVVFKSYTLKNLLTKQTLTFSIQSPNTRNGTSTLRNANNERGLVKHVVTKQLYLYV